MTHHLVIENIRTKVENIRTKKKQKLFFKMTEVSLKTANQQPCKPVENEKDKLLF